MFFKDKIYPISNRPLGNKVLGINNKKNVRSKNWEDLRNSNNSMKNYSENKLNIKTYDENDPDLQIFFDNSDENHNKDHIIPEEKEKEKVLSEDQNSNPIDLKDASKLSDYGVNALSMVNTLTQQSAKSGTSNELMENKKSIVEEATFDLIVSKNEVFREKKITSRPKTAMNKKDFVIKSKV